MVRNRIVLCTASVEDGGGLIPQVEDSETVINLSVRNNFQNWSNPGYYFPVADWYRIRSQNSPVFQTSPKNWSFRWREVKWVGTGGGGELSPGWAMGIGAGLGIP